jgi:hypothetical protein
MTAEININRPWLTPIDTSKNPAQAEKKIKELGERAREINPPRKPPQPPRNYPNKTT